MQTCKLKKQEYWFHMGIEIKERGNVFYNRGALHSSATTTSLNIRTFDAELKAKKLQQYLDSWTRG